MAMGVLEASLPQQGNNEARKGDVFWGGEGGVVGPSFWTAPRFVALKLVRLLGNITTTLTEVTFYR